MPVLPDLPQTEVAIVALTNAFRQEQRLGAVAPNKELTAAARWFADYLAKSGKFAHEADGREPQQRAAAHGYKYCMVAENLALNLHSRGYTSERLAAEVIEGWKASPPHRRAMLEAGATETGVAVAQVPDKDPKFVSVQLFGRPESLKIKFEIRNAISAPVTYIVDGESQSIEPRTIVTQEMCSPGQITFDRAGNWLSGTALGQRFDLKDGARFTVHAGERGSIRVDELASPK